MPPDPAPARLDDIASRSTAILGHAAALARRAFGTAEALKTGLQAAELAGHVRIPAGPGQPDLAGQVQPAPAAPAGVASATIVETIRQAVAEAVAEARPGARPAEPVQGPSSTKRYTTGDEWRQLLEQLLAEIAAKQGPLAASDYRRFARPADVLDDLARHHLHDPPESDADRRTARQAVLRAMDRLEWGPRAEQGPSDSAPADRRRSANRFATTANGRS